MLALIAKIELGKALLLNPSGQTVGDQYSSLAKLVNLVVYNIFILAGILFLFLLILGGLSIISSDSSKGVEEGKKKVVSALIGFLVMFSAYWIVQVVQYLTGVVIIG